MKRTGFNGYEPAEREKRVALYRDLLSKWVARTFETGLWQATEADLAGESKRNDRESLHSWPRLIEAFATFHLARGVGRVLGGEPGGWSEVALSALFHQAWWRAVMAAGGGVDAVPGPWRFIAYYRFSQAGFLAYLLSGREGARRMLEANLLLHENGSAEHSTVEKDYPAFAGWLCRAVLAGRFPETVPDMGPQAAPLAELMAARNDATALARVLPVAMDYHLWRSDDRSSARNPDEAYSQPGIMLLPVPILAFLKLRAELSLPPAPCDHPIMSLPTVDVPSLPLEHADEVLSLVEARVRKLESR